MTFALSWGIGALFVFWLCAGATARGRLPEPYRSRWLGFALCSAALWPVALAYIAAAFCGAVLRDYRSWRGRK